MQQQKRAVDESLRSKEQSTVHLNDLDLQTALVLIGQFNGMNSVVDPDKFAFMFDSCRQCIGMTLNRITTCDIAQFKRQWHLLGNLSA